MDVAILERLTTGAGDTADGDLTTPVGDLLDFVVLRIATVEVDVTEGVGDSNGFTVTAGAGERATTLGVAAEVVSDSGEDVHP